MSLSLYPIIKKLGEGGFGTTYLATNTLMPSQPYCVVKQLTPASTEPKLQQLIKDRFKQEAITLESLGKDSNGKVPSLYAYFVEQGEFYLIQEYIDGQTLNERVQTQGLFTEIQVRQLLTDILPTLVYVHQRGIVHRDIKPENIMLCHQNDKPILIDFGAVKETMSTVMTASGNTAKSIVIGTPGFMPIEQMSGRPMFASDIYALGLTVIYLLTGKMPAEIETDPYSGNINWQSLTPNVSPQLVEVLNKAIQPSSRDRYKNAQEMLLALTTSAQPFISSSTVVSPLPTSDDKTVYVPTKTIVSNYPLAGADRTNPLVVAMLGVMIGGSLIAGGLVLGKSSVEKTSDNIVSNSKSISNDKSANESSNLNNNSSNDQSSTLSTSENVMVGNWAGHYAVNDTTSVLDITEQSGNSFTAQMRTGGKRGGEFTLSVIGEFDLSQKTISFRETGIVASTSRRKWFLGENSGTFSSDLKTMSGSGSDSRGNRYSWILSKR
jgi:serine/threonine protein kinase, bacterial